MDWTNWFGFAAGIGLFLFAMHQLETALHSIGGTALRNLLQKATNSSFGAVLSGTFSTAILQSSSMVGLMVLAMVGSGILPLYNVIGMVIGANLGTTVTGWIVTLLGFKLHLDAFAIPLMGIGAILYLVQMNRDKATGLGLLLFSLGLLLFGLAYMKDSVSSVAAYFDPTEYSNLHSFWFLLIGVALTAIIQSSSATMLITLSALSAGLLPLSAAVAIVIGADLGTTSTMLIGGMQGSVNKKRVAMSHVVFNLMTAVMAYLILLPTLPWLLQLSGLTDPLYSLVAFHSFFNFLGVLLMMPFLKPFSRAIERWFKEPNVPLCQYLDDVQPDASKIALTAMDKEFQRLFRLSVELNCKVLKLNSVDPIVLAVLNQFGKGYDTKYKALKEINGIIVEFILDIRSGSQRHKQAMRMFLKALRKLHYALKCVKDIREDLMQYEMSSLRKIHRISSKRIEQESKHINQILQSLSRTNFSEYDNELNEIVTIAARQHDNFVELLYDLTKGDKLNSKELATLINMSKHVEDCIAAMADSARNYRRSVTVMA